MDRGLGRLREYLLPGSAEDDPRFQRELLRLSDVRLRIIGALAIGVPLLLATAGLPLVPASTGLARPLPSLAMAMCGSAILLIGKLPEARRRPRLAAAAGVVAISGILVGFASLSAAPAAWVQYYFMGYFVAVLLGAAAAIPFQPLHTAALGAALSPLCVPGRFESLFIPLLTVFATGITAAVYRHRVAAWQSQQEALRINECLALAQSRVLLSENAASLGRLAATLVHELNSPLGALSSGVETLIALSARQASAPAEQQARFAALQRDLRRSISESLARLHEIVSRVEHFTGLDEADFQSVNLNELVRDVTALFETQTPDAAQIELDLEPVPALTCQPQQLSAVFSSLFQNAASAADRTVNIRVSSRDTGTHVEIRIEDDGKGIPSEELATILEPGFKVSGSRMATGNWSLFGCRQIVQGHGGEIYLTSEPGKGSCAVIRLPY